MSQVSQGGRLTRRHFLTMVGYAAGGAAMYQAMMRLGHAAEGSYDGPIRLEGKPRPGTSVVILGAGLAGMVAALELRNAGYQVKILEYRHKVGGRNWTLHGGDSYTELGGARQDVKFDKDQYINPGPWRIPFHHRALLDYCKRLKVKLEPFIQYNYNAYLHSKDHFNGKPQRFRHIHADFQGQVSELLSKAIHTHLLDAPLSTEDQEKLLEALRSWGALDKNMAYVKGHTSSEVRGFERDPGGGLHAQPEFSEPLKLADIVRSSVWHNMGIHDLYEFQQTMFQPVGGMDQIGAAFGNELEGLFTFNAKVTAIKQNDGKVTVGYKDQITGREHTEMADWCVCTIPLSILSQIDLDASKALHAAIDAVPYAPSVKVGLQFKRRFWEDDEAIYGGISYTDLPITQISYPSAGMMAGGKGVLLGGYMFGPSAVEWTSLSPEDRIRKAVEYGAQIHPQYKDEFESGVAVAWHRVPWTLGCYGMWTDQTRAAHYENLCQIDGRLVLAGEHASYVNAWQEGAVLSALNAITRLHSRIVGEQHANSQGGQS
ncbi:flavin monoamine oxidase family protein [Alcaligenes sp. Lyrl_28]|uniref:flavin monoamine oxidase family protein n=1 Tax=Alcaligenes sp. Lyrl_28 TaxID=3110924 RepID=UPI003F7B8950